MLRRVWSSVAKTFFFTGLLLAGHVAVGDQLILSDTCNVSGGNSPGTGFGVDGPTAGVNYQIASRLSGVAAASVTYLQTATGKGAANYSIVSNRIKVAVAANAGRYTFTTNRTGAFNLGPALGVPAATPLQPARYELDAKISNASSGIERTSIGLALVDGGVQDWPLGIQLVNNGANLDLYRRVDSSCNPSGVDYNNVIATLVGQAAQEITLSLIVTDAGPESGAGNFNSAYQLFVNGNLVYTSPAGDFRFASSTARLVLFDTAPSAGPVTYDAFALTSLTVTNPPVETNLPPTILSAQFNATGFELSWRSMINTNYSLLKCTNLTAPHWVLVTNLTAGAAVTTATDAAPRSMACYYRVASLEESGLTVSGVLASQRAGTGLVDIYYDLADWFDGFASISVLVSTDGGLTYHAAAASFSGDVGGFIMPGSNRHIIWDAGADWAQLSAANVRAKIIADRAPIGPDVALVPAGSFNMGNAQPEGLPCELPVHPVNLDAFYLGRFEVTKALWDSVVAWGTNHGYSFGSSPTAAATNKPIQQVSWYDAVKWCNARSEMEGLAPAYYTDAAWNSVYRSGEVDLTEFGVRWKGAGYRLPTEAEWEKAARGGLEGKRFPWGDTIDESQADYWSTVFESFDVNGTSGPNPLAPDFPNTLAVGSFPPTGFGLYDLAGNSWEWCWDYYGDSWYSDSRSSNDNTHGPSAASWGGDRVYRGGSGVDNAWKSRVANRADAPPRFSMGHFGFRVVLPAGDAMSAAESPVFNLSP